jgi:hypothetical protein
MQEFGSVQKAGSRRGEKVSERKERQSVPGGDGAGRQAGSRQRAPVGGGGVAQFKVSRIYDEENFEMHLVMDLPLWDQGV